MKISFDLDGVLCKINIPALDQLRSLEGDEQTEREMKYYASVDKKMNPYDFIGEDDEAIILTGRPLHLKDVTMRWLEKNGLGDFNVIFTKSIAGFPKGTNREFETIGKDKATLFMKLDIDVHIDDNPVVVKTMRELLPNVTVIQYGSRVPWR